MTDVLLVANVLMFGLQALTNNLITAWGIKASLPAALYDSCCRCHRQLLLLASAGTAAAHHLVGASYHHAYMP